MHLPHLPIPVYALFIVVAVALLWKAADWFVEGAVGVAERLRLPKMLVGIVLVSLATTSPELLTSVLAALQGSPELALGNAVGSVIVDDGVALGLAALLSPLPLLAHPRILKTSAILLIVVDITAFVMVLNGWLGRVEGAVLLALFAGYVVVSYWNERRMGPSAEEPAAAAGQAKAEACAAAGAGGELQELERKVAGRSVRAIALLFAGGLIGVLIGSELLMLGAVGVAESLGLSKVVIGLTIVAAGTSVPEIATVVTSALKGHSAIGVGNIIGADILNVCVVAGASALVHPLAASRKEVFVMFPAMLAIVGTMLLMLFLGKYRLRRWHGAVLLAMYVAYVAALFVLLPPGGALGAQ